MKVAYDLLDDLAGGVEVDEALVNLKLVAIPGLGTFTARLQNMLNRVGCNGSMVTHSLTGSDL